MKSTVFKNLTENKTTICSLLSRHFYYCVADGAGYLASVFIVSPPGIHISLGICVRGYTYHGDTHITVTPDVLAYTKNESIFAFSPSFNVWDEIEELKYL